MTMQRYHLPLLLAALIAALALALSPMCAHSPPARSSSVDLSVAVAFQVAIVSASLAEDAAVKDQDLDGCVAATTVRAGLAVAADTWWRLSEEVTAPDGIWLPPTIRVDVGPCVGLGLPPPAVSVDRVVPLLRAVETSLRSLAGQACAGGREDCVRVQVVLATLGAIVDLTGSILDELAQESASPDGLLVVEMGPVNYPLPAASP